LATQLTEELYGDDTYADLVQAWKSLTQGWSI